MKIALVTTTINVPRVLELYRTCSKNVEFFIVADKKTPVEAALVPGSWIFPQLQDRWKCSELIGWNCIQRRNIGFLEALKEGADVIVSIDDDNIPMSTSYFDDFETVLTMPFNGIGVRGEFHWIDIGQYLVPPAKHRGFPYRATGRGVKHQPVYQGITNTKVAVAAGMCLGDPDIDAVTRMAMAPEIQQISQIAESGAVIFNYSWTVFNSQNTAMLREFIPAWFMWPGVGRMDDIYASLVVQRVMRERDYHVHFGRPFVLQQRNQHNLVKDLRAEIDGYENVWKLAVLLDALQLPGESVLDDCRWIWNRLADTDWVPQQTVWAARAYLDDCETVL